jgi:hypothetical protein
MKRYLVFLVRDCPNGGWGDFEASFSNLLESLVFISKRKKDSDDAGVEECAQLVDLLHMRELPFEEWPSLLEPDSPTSL